MGQLLVSEEIAHCVFIGNTSLGSELDGGTENGFCCSVLSQIELYSPESYNGFCKGER